MFTVAHVGAAVGGVGCLLVGLGRWDRGFGNDARV